jgi:hypothetical protein
MKPNINDQVVQFVDLYEIVERQAEEIERLRKVLEGIATSKTSLASTLKTMAGEALRRDTHT